VPEVWTTLRVLDWTTRRFEEAGSPSARLDAQVLLAHVLGCDRVALYTGFDKPLAELELAGYRDLIRRRLAGEPIAYLVGHQEFWSLSLRVDPAVLIPRRDTETLVEVGLDHMRGRGGAGVIADVATGSGAVAIALAHELPAARVVATDVSAGAIALAADNAARAGVADRIELRAGDLLAPLAGERFDLLVANLPYVRSGDIAALPADVRHEPRAALDGGPDGLALLRRLVDGAAAHVAPGGLLALEHGFDQAAAVAGLIDAAGGFEPPATRADLAGHPRVTSARRRAG
jgi:release factor glutamine methyltransferase